MPIARAFAGVKPNRPGINAELCFFVIAKEEAMKRFGLLCLLMIVFCAPSHAKDCAKMTDSAVFARAMVVGATGAWEKVEIRCGDEVIATCTATVPVGGNKDSCKTDPKPLTAGEYDCKGTASEAPKPALESANCY